MIDKANPLKIPFHKNLKDIVNIQVDINRAVYAGNLLQVNSLGLITTENGRDEYVKMCLKSAFETLKKMGFT